MEMKLKLSNKLKISEGINLLQLQIITFTSI